MTEPCHPLDQISIASPCSADWNEMKGDETVRFCGLCQLNVYNLSGMSRSDAEELVLKNEGRLCVRFFRREDGTLLTRDCPVGIQALHQRKLRRFRRLGAAAAAVTLITAVGVFTSLSQAAETGGRVANPREMGDVAMPNHTQGAVPVTPRQGNIVQPVEMKGEMVSPELQKHLKQTKPPKQTQPPKTTKPPKSNTQSQGQPLQGSPVPPKHLMGKVKAPD